jgi:flagellar protein FliS
MPIVLHMARPVKPTSEYLRTKVLTASPQELRLMLLEGAIRFAEKGREGLLRCDFEMVYAELCQRLSGLYTFLYVQLMKASTAKDPAIVENVVRLLQYERETWSMLLQKLADENAAARGLTQTPQAAPPDAAAASSAAAPTAAPGLVAGSISLQG